MGCICSGRIPLLLTFPHFFKLFHIFLNFSTLFQTFPHDKEKDKDKVDKFQPIKSYILWKLMTPTITWPTDKVDKDKVDEDKVEFLVP